MQLEGIESRVMRPTPHLMLLVMLAATSSIASCDTGGEQPPTDDAPSTPSRERASDIGDGRITREGLYRVTLRSRAEPIPLGRMHDWTVKIETPSGEPVRPKRLAFSGGMPQHDHGFITVPRVTRVLGEGLYLIEGVKFHMGGDWQLRVEVVGPSGPDVVVAEVRVGP